MRNFGRSSMRTLSPKYMEGKHKKKSAKVNKYVFEKNTVLLKSTKKNFYYNILFTITSRISSIIILHKNLNIRYITTM